MSHFIVTDRKTDYLLPPSLDDWLHQDHLARFIVEVVDQLDLSKLTRQYAGRGSKAYHPATLLAILVYGYTTGIFSSRRLEWATYDSVAFRYITAGSHPDHDSLATFRRRFLDDLSDLFVQILAMAQEMKLLKLGNVCLDGTKIEANASRHSALSRGPSEKREAQLKAEVQELFMEMAESNDQSAKVDRRKTRQVGWKEVRLSLAHPPGSVTPVFGATVGPPDQVGETLFRTAVQAGLGRKTQVHAVSDGAAWIAAQVSEQFGRHGHFLVDFYHACDYLTAAGKTIASTAARAWLETQKDRLKQNRLQDVLDELQRFVENDTVPDDNVPVRASLSHQSPVAVQLSRRAQGRAANRVGRSRKCTPLRHPGSSQAGRRLVETEKRQAHAGATRLPCQPEVGQLLAVQTTTGGLIHSRTSDCTLDNALL